MRFTCQVMDSLQGVVYKTTSPAESRMRHIVPTVLILVAAIHALPVVGLLGADTLAQLYGITVQEPNLALLAGVATHFKGST